MIRPIEAYLGEPALPSAAEVGGKAAGLVWLARRGFQLPQTWIMAARPFRDLVRRRLGDGLEPAALLRAVGDRTALGRMGRARQIVLSEPLDACLREELGELWRQLGSQAPWGLAVRSSATCEDGQLTSMAGLATTVLGVRGHDALCDAVRQIWASALLPRALGHLAARGVRDVAMAVVIQAVVPADSSGVMVTRPGPGIDGRVWAADERMINATLGLGVPVVNGAAAPDTFRIAAASGAVRHRTIAVKTRALVVGEQGPAFVAVAPERVRTPALAEAELRELGAIADELERTQDVAFDVEFAVQDGRIVLVQARAVVGRGFPEGGDAQTLWSRANVGEALPGVATPLTWSVASAFSERGFRQAFGSLGCRVPPGARLVGNVHGRFYLNMSEFMRIAAQVPGLDARTLMEVGGGEGAELLDGRRGTASRAGFLARLPGTLAGLLVEQVTLARRVREHDERCWPRYRAERDAALGARSDGELAAALRRALGDLDDTGTLMLAAASASLGSHLLLVAFLGWAQPDDPQRLAQALTAGAGGLESAAPGMAIAELAAQARICPDLAEGLLHDRYARLEDLPAGAVRRGLERFLERFGDRAVREPELRTPRWSEEPRPILRMIAAALRQPDDRPEQALGRARARAEGLMVRLGTELGWPRAALLRLLVARTRQTAELRETMRGWVTRRLGAIRRVACEIDRRLRRAHPELDPDAAFFCTHEELLGALDSGGSTDLVHLVHMRRAEHRRDEGRPDPPVTFVGRPPPVVLPPTGNGVMRGLPASEGVVEGPVRVLGGADNGHGLEPGEILGARTTDVGLSPLFLVASGVITELGGPLSHAALVAREYGVPAVVNVAGATVALRTGERVRLDGGRGTVERLEPAAPWLTG